MIEILTTETARNWILPAALAAIATPLVGSLLAALGVARRMPRRLAVTSASCALAAALAVTALWQAGDGHAVTFGEKFGGGWPLHIDGLTAVLLPYVALVELAIVLVAPRRALEEEAVMRTLLCTAATLAFVCTSHPGLMVFLWIATALPVWLSTKATPGGRTAARVFAIYLTVGTACLTAGVAMLVADPPWERSSGLLGVSGGWLVALAVMVREGVFPFHSWYPALFSGAPMSTALTATMPQVGAYTAVRLLVGHADGVASELEALSQAALVTTVYGAALATVQRDLRGFIGALSLSQSAVVLAGLSGTLPMELNGAFCLWISSGVAITGIGLVTWALESRAGTISLESLQGRFWDAPALAGFFLLFGMATIGLPGTFSFVAGDIMVSGSLDDQLHAGLMVILSTVLSGIAVMRCWFHVFGGPSAVDSPRHAILRREKVPMTVLFLALVAAGLNPRPLILMLERAAAQILQRSQPAGDGHEHGHDAACFAPPVLAPFAPGDLPEKKGMSRC
jgi:NADH-quinone oxidoreductase subunit M